MGERKPPALPPKAYIYHYNHYEETAIKRLASCYGTRESVVDDLLRGRRLVDLYTVVRESVRVSEPRYSLKNLEIFYMERRSGEVKTAGDSIAVYENWRRTSETSLDYLLQGAATISPERGIFLPKTWRMHEDVCRFIST